MIVTADGKDLNELLVNNGLVRIYGTRTPLPDGRDSREYLARLAEFEMKASKQSLAAGKILDSTSKPSPGEKPG